MFNKAPFRILFFLLLLFVLKGGTFLSAQENPGPEPLSAKLALIGPGDELYFWWGHIGLVVENNISGEALFFDWGVFDFNQENFFVNFAMGWLYYYCAATPAWMNYHHLTYTNRDIILYTLDLSQDKIMEIIRFAENSIRPENRDYRYHHFRDNCATRIRDVIDMAVEGQFKAAFGEAPGRFTLREHVRRHTWQNLFIDWILNFWMGQGIDRPIRVWDEMFLPSEIILRVLDFQYLDSDGVLRPLVKDMESVNLSSGRPAVLEEPRTSWPALLLFSLGLSLVIFLSYRRFKEERAFKIFLGLTNSCLGLFFGIAGLMLFFMSFFTDHDYTFHNSNIFFVNPLFLAAIPLGIILGFSKSYKKRFISVKLLRILWLSVLLGGLLTMGMKLFPSYYQQNQASHALLLPLALGMVFVLTRLYRWKT